MRVLYGFPLPPGVDAPTRGELCIRVEKLLLKDNLVHPNIISKASSTHPRPYAIPANHCAISPLFWGEQHATCQCIPATPGNPRGAVSLVYPLKTYEPQFNEYLAHMSNSNHKGVQISVFVPTSYSGRHRPIPVGKSIIPLDALRPSFQISGWFPIMSDKLLLSDGSETATLGVFVDVGKLKLTFSVTFFVRIPLSPSRSASLFSPALPRSKSVVNEDKIDRKLLHNESPNKRDFSPATKPFAVSAPGSGGGSTTLSAVPQQQEDVKADSKGEMRDKQLTSLLDNAADQGLASATRQRVTLPATAAAVSPAPAREPGKIAAIGDLLQKGLILRDKMAKALSPSIGIDDLTSFSTLPLTRPPLDTSRITSNLSPLLTFADHLHNSPTISCLSAKNSFGSSLSSASVDNVQDSDEKITTVVDLPQKSEPVLLQDASQEQHCFKVASGHLESSLADNCYVEVDLSQIAFSSGRATLGMEEMRVDIRLSKDVKTDEPVESYSSYVHRVPLVRGADHHIVIGFLVRSFNDKSRMVISFYRVRSAPVLNPPMEQLPTVPATAQRMLVEETLLGMCIVGLYNQSRDVLFHDPVTGEDPTEAHLRVCIRRASHESSAETGQITKKVVRGLEKKEHKTALEKDIVRNVKFCHDGCGVINRDSQRGRYSKVEETSSEEGDDNAYLRGSSSSSSISSLSLQSSLDKVQRKVKCGENSCNNETLPGPSGKECRQHFLHSDYSDVNGNEKLKSNAVQYESPTTANITDAGGGNGEDKFVHYLNTTSVLPFFATEKQAADYLPERFRIHVTIRAGKELPMVTLTRKGPPIMSFVEATDYLENGVRSVVTTDGRLIFVDSEERVFQPPSTFFVIEDILSAVDSRAASKGVVPDWFVEAAVRGVYDRTLVVPETQSPQYNYECILSLPREAVFLRHASEPKNVVFEEKKKRLACAKDDPLPKPPVASICLQELHLTLWHAAQDVNNEELRETKDGEERFWAKTAVLGECRVDLRSLRFLKVLDGWYRVHAIDKSNEIIGYVRVSVQPL